MRLGIYVGSFNPVHSTHLKIATLLLDMNLLDKLVFVPVGDDYEKQGLASGKDRLNMLFLATKHESRFLVSDLEIRHGKLFTFQTLEEFRKNYPDDEIYLIIGADNLKEFYWWHKANEILLRYKIFVLTRDGMHSSDFPEYENNPNVIFIDFDIPMSATSVRVDFESGDISSAKSKLNEQVFDYIVKNKLYGSEL